ncbi:cysteine--tRNA ligase [Pedobacter sp.]|nr:cysteine--tRNA ligase [Candidatus Saccharibacteria bacterium]
MIKLHNTLTGLAQDFIPQSPDSVSLYTCGPTVYNDLHVGNWIAYLRWDILVRALLAEDYTVDRVMNITDVGHLVSDADDGEDKMQKGAQREGVSAWDIAARYTDSFIKGMDELGLVSPQHLVKATDHIPQQIALIQKLEEKGYTYTIDDGVYFDTSKFPTYGDFAHLDMDNLRAGARIQFNQQKHSPTDFAVWKFSPVGEQRDMEWESPWGKGFPGWHVECSAMAIEYLGATLDIHTGGIDHIPVHHTNEIAQSEAATGVRFANYWLHANFLMADGQKVSKSLENGYTLDDISQKGYSPYDFRMFALQSHYRTESNFTWENLHGAAQRLKHWLDAANIRWQMHDTLVDDEDKSADESNVALLGHLQAAQDAVRDDLNTPEALKIIEEALALLTKERTDIQQGVFEKILDFIEEQCGLPIRTLTPDIDEDAKLLLIERMRAREAKNWIQSDSLRDKLLDRDISVRDDASGQIWSRS